MVLDVNVICRNFREDRVIPRFSRYLSDFLGWEVSAGPVSGADVYYLSAYFEIQMFKGGKLDDAPKAAYFTHKEINPPGNAKAALFDRVAAQVDLRIVTASMYAEGIIQFGDTVKIFPPVERHRFTIPKKKKNQRFVAGFSGFTYRNGRKGESLARRLVKATSGEPISWVASGRGWPVETVRVSWRDLPAFYQSLDVLVVTASVEGVPMPPLEVLSCGGSVVIPRGVGLLDDLPDLPGIHRYNAGDLKSLLSAFHEAAVMRSSVKRSDLRDATWQYSILSWCEQHRAAFEDRFIWQI